MSNPTQKKLRINFVLPPCPTITGGPLAILEYANRLIDRGHEVSITTAPELSWSTSTPFPWMKFKGLIHYSPFPAGFKRPRSILGLLYFAFRMCLRSVFSGIKGPGIDPLRQMAILFLSLYPVRNRAWRGENLGTGFRELLTQFLEIYFLTDAIPDCDINIATWWMTAFPVLWSGKGKPVYFIQHFEEIFYGQQYRDLAGKLFCRVSYELPLFKVGNSSWLAGVFKDKFDQDIPWSNNAIDLKDFGPLPKTSLADNIIRIVTYSKPEEWKGFSDAVAIISKVKKMTKTPIEWHVFGYSSPDFPPDNPYCAYQFHPKLSFKDLAKLYATSDINLFCSWYESFPLPPLEAMASGTSVLTTSLGTEEYAIHDKTAYVFEPRQTDVAVSYLLKLIEDSKLRNRLAEAGLLMAKNFGWDKAVDTREKILFDIHEGRSNQNRHSPSEAGFIDKNHNVISFMPPELESFSGKLIMSSGEPDVYLVQRGTKRAVELTILDKLKVKFGDVLEVASLDLHRIPTGYEIFDINQI